MTKIVIEASRGGTVKVLPHGGQNRFYSLLASPPPNSVELLHVLWSGEAIFFVHNLPLSPTPEEMTAKIEPGSVTWFPELGEVIIAYGTAAPRDKHGAITVARVGTIEDIAVLREIGRRIWLHGSEKARLLVTS